MQEIASHVFIETIFPGVTLGAISWPHGLLLVDAPFRQDDIRAWRSALLNLSGGVDRLLVNLDSHLDRTLGVRSMDCTVVSHETMAEVFRNRPINFKAQPAGTGAEWEMYDNIGSVRWLLPEITFTDEFHIHWDGDPCVFQHRPGPMPGSLWVVLNEQRVIFLGDAVVTNQPPFLANADLPLWIEQLNTLLANDDYRQSLLVSSRSGLVTADDVRKQVRFLEQVHEKLEEMNARGADIEETPPLVSKFLSSIKPDPEKLSLYQDRLRYGLQQYYARHYRPSEAVDTEIP
jgi:glyoxylase-like metal-dependent hydrolase (beta-lactamase superfamily II)